MRTFPLRRRAEMPDSCKEYVFAWVSVSMLHADASCEDTEFHQFALSDSIVIPNQIRKNSCEPKHMWVHDLVKRGGMLSEFSRVNVCSICLYGVLAEFLKQNEMS
ncbi:hypothetical protein DPX16_12459 [Anabarilius grahami]|uniref:Uncharacterized protein n=1 Tax=Anabarilius grahami TaxID=495550 RepID=A0A3N0XHW2_ANAGA|nr:hypothetical protein DPX16_12459 [Anabarilius grahami]